MEKCLDVTITVSRKIQTELYQSANMSILVGALVAIFIFPYIGNVIIPIDVHIFQRGGPTTNQNKFLKMIEILVTVQQGALWP